MISLAEISRRGAGLIDVSARIADSFFKSGYVPLRAVSVDASGGVITLRGRVPSIQLKKIAQHRAIRVPGVLVVDNQIAVE